MKIIFRFWQSLENIPGLACVTAEWHRQLGEEYDLLRGLLRPTGELAVSYPHEDGLPYKVVCHATDDYVAVCPEGAPSIQLKKTDLVVYGLDVPKLSESISKALKIDYRLEQINAIPYTWQLGHAAVPGKGRCPVLLSIQFERSEYRQAFLEIRDRYGDSLALLTPTITWIGADEDSVLQATPSIRVRSLTDLVGLDSNGEITAGTGADSWLVHWLPAAETESEQRSWPDPKQHTTAKVWTTKDGSLWLSTKTDGEHDGKVPFALNQDGSPTYQMQFMRLICFQHPNSVLLKDVMGQVYPEDCAAIGKDPQAMTKLLRKVRSLVSDVRVKKFGKAGINPDILPPLSFESSVGTGISLRLAKLHRLDDKAVDN